MTQYSKQVSIRWSDLDPNFHLRHSIYYDLAAYVRTCYMEEMGINATVFMKEKFAPIIFREECVFKKEIVLGDVVTVNASLIRARPDYSRWTIVNEFYKNEGILAAVLTLDGAWMDLTTRKLYQPKPFLIEAFEKISKHEGFLFEEKK